MATKTSTVIARVEPEIKQQAETILSDMGLSASTAINMFYRQIIVRNGLPFRPSTATNRPLSRDEMTDEEFNARIMRAYEESLVDRGAPAEEVFKDLIEEIENGSSV